MTLLVEHWLVGIGTLILRQLNCDKTKNPPQYKLGGVEIRPL